MKKYIFENKLSNKEINWILSQFPDNYESYNFVVYNDKNLLSLINKKKSEVEIVANDDSEINNFYKTARDQDKNLTNAMKKLSCTKKTFVQLDGETETKTSLKKAEKYIFVQKMTKNKKILPNIKKASVEWKKTIDTVKQYADRIKDTHFVDMSHPEKFLKTFSSNNYFLFLCFYTSNKQTSDIIEIHKTLANSKSKVCIFDEYNPITKRIFCDWNMKKISKKDSSGNFCVWKNY